MSKDNRIFYYGDDKLSIGASLELARGKRKGIIGKRAAKRIDASFQAVQDIVQREETVYGVNTGFGPLCTTVISKEDSKKLQ